VTLIAAGRQCQENIEDSKTVCEGCNVTLGYSRIQEGWVAMGENPHMPRTICPVSGLGHRRKVVYEEFRCPNPATWRVDILAPDFENRVVIERPSEYLCDICIDGVHTDIEDEGTGGNQVTLIPLDPSGTLRKVVCEPAVVYGPS
jgi:hypothetical protein